MIRPGGGCCHCCAACVYGWALQLCRWPSPACPTGLGWSKPIRTTGYAWSEYLIVPLGGNEREEWGILAC
jgi:hypothetical protein